MNSVDSNKFQGHFFNVKLVIFDFDGVFTDNMVYVSDEGKEFVRCCRGDGIGLERLKKIGVGSFIVSTEKNPVVSVRASKLGIPCIQGCLNKREECLRLSSSLGIGVANIAFVGNDINDLGALELVGFPIAVKDSHSDVLAVVLYVTEHLGGHGAVREICDLIVKAYTERSDNK